MPVKRNRWSRAQLTDVPLHLTHCASSAGRQSPKRSLDNPCPALISPQLIVRCASCCADKSACQSCRLGLEEGFAELMAHLPLLHAGRVAALAAAYDQEAATLQAAHQAECAIVDNLNAEIQRYRKSVIIVLQSVAKMLPGLAIMVHSNSADA